LTSFAGKIQNPTTRIQNIFLWNLVVGIWNLLRCLVVRISKLKTDSG